MKRFCLPLQLQGLCILRGSFPGSLRIRTAMEQNVLVLLFESYNSVPMRWVGPRAMQDVSDVGRFEMWQKINFSGENLPFKSETTLLEQGVPSGREWVCVDMCLYFFVCCRLQTSSGCGLGTKCCRLSWSNIWIAITAKNWMRFSFMLFFIESILAIGSHKKIFT